MLKAFELHGTVNDPCTEGCMNAAMLLTIILGAASLASLAYLVSVPFIALTCTALSIAS